MLRNVNAIVRFLIKRYADEKVIAKPTPPYIPRIELIESVFGSET